VRHGDEHDSPHVRVRLEEQCLRQFASRTLVGVNLLKRPSGHGSPQRIAAFDDLQLRDQSAHAVSDEDHVP
jgi:hypothetical protein